MSKPIFKYYLVNNTLLFALNVKRENVSGKTRTEVATGARMATHLLGP